MNTIWQDFKDFDFKGNVLDLAIAVVIGAAFGKIITSLVNDIIMPIIAKLFGTEQFADLTAWGIKYGAFIQCIINFLLVAAAIFFVILLITKGSRLLKTKEKQEEEAEETSEDLLKDIRDLLRKEQNHD